MDPTNHRPEEHGRDQPIPHPAEGHSPTPAPVRTVQLVSGDYLLTINPVDGSEIEPCPPGGRPAFPERRGPDERAELRRAAAPPLPAGAVGFEVPMLEREEERERLARLLARGRSVRVTGPSGAGRSTLLDAVAADCETLAPDGVVRLSGYRRTPTDLLYELYAAVYRAPLYRPDRAELPAAVAEIGAVVVLDDIEFGGAALDELLDATPECAFLISATPAVVAPSADSHLEEVFLSGLSRTGSLDLLERAVRRPLEEDERGWAGDLWFESEGLPLRFLQAGALLRQRDALRAGHRPTGTAAPAEEAGSGDPSGSADAVGSGDASGSGGSSDSGDISGSGGSSGSADVLGSADASGSADALDSADASGSAGHSAEAGATDIPLPTLAEGAAPVALIASRLSEAARDTLRFAVALGGECPHQSHLPALAGDTHDDTALGELIAGGLVTPAGPRYRLAVGVADQLAADGYADGQSERASAVAQHYAWWAGHPSVAPERVAVEADAILTAMAALVAAREADRAETAVLLARSATPAFAAALHWGAWERALRHGQEAARLAGQVAEEAYFHHELGVLALCTGNPDRARAELEASIGLRGALADKRGTVAGRRALALVTDRTRGSAGPGVFAAPGGRTAAGEEGPDARHNESAQPYGEVPVRRRDPTDTEITVVTPQVETTARLSSTDVLAAVGTGGPGGKGGGAGAGRVAGAGRQGGGRSPLGRRFAALTGARRNLLATGAGALLVAVLGTVVALGITSGDGDKGSTDTVKPGQSSSRKDDDKGLTAEEPTSGAGESQQPGPSGVPGAPTAPSTLGSNSPSASESPTAPSSSGEASPTGKPSSSSSSGSTTRPPTHSPTTPPTTPPTTTKTPPTTPTTTPPTSSTTSPGGGTTNTASGPATTASGSPSTAPTSSASSTSVPA